MEDLKEQQVEALQVLKEYNEKLTKSVLLVVEELRGKRQKDTDEFLKKIIEGINWEIQIYNGTKDVVRVDREEMNRHIVAFGEAVQAKEDTKLADSFEIDILPLLAKLGDAAGELLGSKYYR